LGDFQEKENFNRFGAQQLKRKRGALGGKQKQMEGEISIQWGKVKGIDWDRTVRAAPEVGG